jgi:hypothetical protein
MRRALVFGVIAAACLTGAPIPKPKLIVTVVVDQFRYDYLTRYRNEYTGGFNRLLSEGAVFTNARYMHVPAVTAVGHSTVLSGAIPSISGIVGNDWFDPDEGMHVTSVSDAQTQLIGGKGGTGSSPHRLLVDTIGDEQKLAQRMNSHVIGISLKDRSAILPAGHSADAAYWFDTTTGNFVTSTYYRKELPPWAADFNASRMADQHKGEAWLGHKLPDDAKLYSALEANPLGNDLIQAFAERALSAEQLGKHTGTDILAVSFSSNDYVGHAFGPESPEARDISVRTDRALERLLAAATRQAGAGNVLVILTADHGAPPTPEANAARKMPGGRIAPAVIRDAVQNALVNKYGPGEWIAGHYDVTMYLNRKLIAEKKLDRAEVEREAARAVEALPHVFRVYTRDEVAKGQGLRDDVTQRVMNGYNLRRGPDLEILVDPYWMIQSGSSGETHAAPFGYDQHVPVIFMGPGIRPGRYNGAITVNDIAPTLATILDIETPSGSVGRVLTEILE